MGGGGELVGKNKRGGAGFSFFFFFFFSFPLFLLFENWTGPDCANKGGCHESCSLFVRQCPPHPLPPRIPKRAGENPTNSKENIWGSLFCGGGGGGGD